MIFCKNKIDILIWRRIWQRRTENGYGEQSIHGKCSTLQCSAVQVSFNLYIKFSSNNTFCIDIFSFYCEDLNCDTYILHFSGGKKYASNAFLLRARILSYLNIGINFKLLHAISKLIKQLEFSVTLISNIFELFSI